MFSVECVMLERQQPKDDYSHYLVYSVSRNAGIVSQLQRVVRMKTIIIHTKDTHITLQRALSSIEYSFHVDYIVHSLYC